MNSTACQTNEKHCRNCGSTNPDDVGFNATRQHGYSACCTAVLEFSAFSCLNIHNPANKRTDYLLTLEQRQARLTEARIENNLALDERDRLALIARRGTVTNPNDSVTVRLARTFYDDSVSRCLKVGRVVTTNSRTVSVELNFTEYEELLSDAKFYAGDEDDFDRNLVDSAKRVVAALNKVGTPWIKVQA